ncbi:MAG: HypC/HybG/HupF family hydrogenase formation chaperone [Elusimicrobia bacterium]|nr:HypC/HybG/HupF family hydrogenase formation chaperone [Elusimicrobiota bacterium]
MCLAIPGKVISIDGKIANVDFSGLTRKVGLDLLPNVKCGDYIIVHAGFAIQIIGAKDAKERIEIFKKIYND